MPLETLDFEEPIAVLLKEIEALGLLPRTDARDREIETLRRRIETVRGRSVSVAHAVAARAWSRVIPTGRVSRTSSSGCSPNFVEIHGDRRFADDHAIMTGFADYKGQPVLLVGHVKGGDTKEKIFRNFGYARPGGLSQGASRDAPRREIPPADHRVRRHAGRLSRHRVRGARRRRGDRRQPARHDAARHARSSSSSAAKAAAAARSASRSAIAC